jgi:hypothetical protein
MLVPTVGSNIKLLVKNPHARAMIPMQPTVGTIEGIVLKPYKWLTDREFCLSGDKDMPIRVISMSLVEDIELLSGTLNKIDNSVQVYQVSGSKGNTYTVTKNSNGYTCTCPGFTFRKSCKHVANTIE